MSAIVFQDGVTPLNAVSLNSLNAVQAGTLAARPAANTVPAGRLYIATDAMGIFRSDGAAWLLVAQGMPLVTPAAFAGAPWNAPYDGMRVALLVDAANGIEWAFRYNAGSASAYKWEFTGGAPRLAGPGGAISLNVSSTWTDLTSGPLLTAPRAGEYQAALSMFAQTTAFTAAYNALMRIASNLTSYTGLDAFVFTAQFAGGRAAYKLAPALAAGETLKAQCYTNVAVATTFNNAVLELQPVRIS
jgi:hypothetical protein